MSENSVLVIAFDGLDKELIDEFDLEHIKQEEYGSIDNKTGMTNIMTSELYASFITGKTHHEHGIKGLKKDLNPKRTKIREFLAPSYLNKLPGFEAYENLLEKNLPSEERKYRKQDLESDSLFEKLENSRSMFVPSYNPSMIWFMMGFGKPLEYGYSQKEILETWDHHEYEPRKKKLFKELNNEIVPPRNFLMCHFHRPDTHQHFFMGNVQSSDLRDSEYGKSKLKKLYQEIDQLAKEIKEKAEGKGYNTIIFMSDHGLPTETEHNENAFYSCNTDLFQNKTPKITDFYDHILEAVNE